MSARPISFTQETLTKLNYLYFLTNHIHSIYSTTYIEIGIQTYICITYEIFSMVNQPQKSAIEHVIKGKEDLFQ